MRNTVFAFELKNIIYLNRRCQCNFHLSKYFFCFLVYWEVLVYFSLVCKDFAKNAKFSVPFLKHTFMWMKVACFYELQKFPDTQLPLVLSKPMLMLSMQYFVNLGMVCQLGISKLVVYINKQQLELASVMMKSLYLLKMTRALFRVFCYSKVAQSWHTPPVRFLNQNTAIITKPTSFS